MRIYHFTPAHMLAGCKRDGVTRGALPIFGPSGELQRMLKGIQWLTSNPSWEQPWATQVNVPYPRTAFRIELAIPKATRDKLRKWTDICDTFGPHTVNMLNHDGYDPENWFVFMGRIPPGWFRCVEKNPANPIPTPKEGQETEEP